VNLPVEMICAPGYSRKARNVSRSEKMLVCSRYKVSPDKCDGQHYEIDHLIALEIGGSNDIANLWPEPLETDHGAEVKDRFENYLHKQVCSGKMSLSEAQRELRGDWYKQYRRTMR
jgi:hypothetical protein